MKRCSGSGANIKLKVQMKMCKVRGKPITDGWKDWDEQTDIENNKECMKEFDIY